MVTEERGARGAALWRDGFFWLSLAFTVFAVAPFLQPGYFWGANDARHHVYFLFEFDRVVQDGVWWPRWSPDFAFGYGYPFFNIYGPFSHFIAEFLLRFGGFGYTGAVEAVFVAGVIAAAGAMYGYGRELAGRAAGVVAALLYTYAPYHLLVLFVRANLAEASAFVWMPLCLWSFHLTVARPTMRSLVAAAVCYAGLMLTSNLVFVLFTPVLALYVLTLLLWRTRQTSGIRRPWSLVRRGLWPLAGAVGGLGLSAIFWIPMVLERQYVRVDQWFAGRYDFRDDFVYFFQLFSPRWGFGISVPGPDDPIGFQIGPVLLLLALLGGLIGWRRGLRPLIGVFTVTAIGAAAIGLVPFAPLWEWPVIGGVLQFAQFPWRWLPITMLGLSVIGGLVALPAPGETPARWLSLSLFVLVAAIVVSSYPLLRVEIREPAEGPVSLAALMRFERDADELTGSTAWVREIPTWSPMAEYYVQLDEAGQPVTPVESKVDYASVDYDTLVVGSVAHNTVMEEVYFCTNPGSKPGACSPRDDKRIVFNHFYYPGWRAFLLDGKHGKPVEELPIIPEEEGVLGRMTVPVPPVGEGYILLTYGSTPARTAGLWTSVVFLGLMILGMVISMTPRRT